VKSEDVGIAARDFRRGLQKRASHRYRKNAEQLYDWLIRPVRKELEARKVSTLVIAPDSVLRLIPFAALHDGKGFLVEKYAVVTIPAVTLTDPRPFEHVHANLLASGLSEARHGFPALPGVPRELADIEKVMGGRKLLDAQYTTGNLEGEFGGQAYSVVHMATHGMFGSSAKDTFLLTYDGRLTMDRLEELIHIGQFRETPVELLTLSACQTALGDERAALGLAGVAVRAGARSALATLWSVHDEATAMTVAEFYRQLKIPGASKAEALQHAQRSMIAKPQYQHPIYWAPFLLIGNWM